MPPVFQTGGIKKRDEKTVKEKCDGWTDRWTDRRRTKQKIIPKCLPCQRQTTQQVPAIDTQATDTIKQKTKQFVSFFLSFIYTATRLYMHNRAVISLA